MNSRERVFKALKKIDGMPDRVPVQFDLCRQHTEWFGKKLGIKPDYALSYYEDLTYRISANEIRTGWAVTPLLSEAQYLPATNRRL